MGNFAWAILTHLEAWYGQTEEQRVDATKTHRLLMPYTTLPNLHDSLWLNKGIHILYAFRLLYAHDYRPPQCIVQRHCSSPSSPNPGAAVTRSGRASTEFEQVHLITTTTLADSV